MLKVLYEDDEILVVIKPAGVESQVLIMLAVLLANTVFYKAKKHLLTRNDADGRRFIICYIHHQDGQKH